MSHQIIFSLEPAPPFRLDLTVWALRRRPDNEIDRWDGETYQRVLSLNGEPVGVAVTQTGPPDVPRLRVTVTGARAKRTTESYVSEALDRLLNLQANLSGFYRLAETDHRLRMLAQRFCGLKPPRFPTQFEALANGIACQQITLTLGRGLTSVCGTGRATK